MVDPCWLPSAIMQTVGALYAVFIAIFILTLKHLKEHDLLDYEIDSEIPYLSRSEKPPIIKHFILLSVIIGATILGNGLFIFMFSITNPVVESIMSYLALSFISLISSVFYIFYISYILIMPLMKKDEQTDS